MTQYLSKLARRLATIYALVGVTACSDSAPRDFLGPDPTTPPPSSGPVSLHIAPKSGAIAANQPLQFSAWGRTASGDSVGIAVSWNASGGQIGPDGVFRSAAGGTFAVQAFAVGKPNLTDGATVAVQAPASIFSALHVLPGTASVPMGGTLQFHASAPLLTGGSTVPSVAWTATGGTISSTGLYSAGMAPGQFLVMATTMDGVHSDTVHVTVAAASLQSLTVSPKALTMSAGDQVDFAVAGQWSDGTSSPPSVAWTAQGGAVSSLGRFTAGTTPGVYPVVARHVPSARADTALVTIMPGVARIEVSPGSYAMHPGASKAFEARAIRTDGVVLPVAATWSAEGGTISPAGVYLAGQTPGSFRVIARYLGGAYADTATVTIALPAATLTGLAITPKTAAVGSGGQVSFTAVPTWSDGSSAQPVLVWSTPAGQVSGDGTWTAPTAAGSYRVVVRHAASGLADTATVTVTEAPRVTGVTILGQVHSLQTGGTKQFAAQATWSDGVDRPVEWLWSATGGTISVNGLYSAGSLAGQFLVIASCLGCAASDTTGVTVTSAPPPAATLLSLTLSPSQALLNPGDVLPLHLAASWSDGSTQVPDIHWTVAGGVRSGLNYTAGSTEGTFLVIARHAAGTLADTTAVTIVAPAGPPPPPPPPPQDSLTSLLLNPATVTMNAGEQRTLTVAATWSNGSTTLPPLSWEATGGTLNGLVYTAGGTAGSFRIIVRHQGGTLADTTLVTVVVPPPTLVALTVSPGSASVPAGFSAPFSVTGTMSDSSVVTPTVAWTATGGTVTSGGVFTAGPAAGSYQVTATHAASGLSAQAAVTVTTGGGGGGSAVVPELPRVFLNTTYVAPTGQVINVAAGGNLQAAINSAACGDEIRLAPGAVFPGPVVLPARDCANNPIHLRTAGTLPPEGVRVNPTVAAAFAKIRTGNVDAALRAAPSARGYRIIALEFTAASNVTLNYGLVRVGEANETSAEVLPGDVVLDRVYIHGHATLNLQRCVALNGVRTAVVDSYLAQCHAKGFESQAIAGWAGLGPFKIVNNYLEGAGINVIFGGAPMRFGAGAADIEIRRNHFHKPLAWMPGRTWTVKNLFELKNAQRVLFEGNVLENSWADAQTGYGILFQSLNDGAGSNAPPATVRDVTIRNNWMRNTGNGVNIAAAAQYPGDGPVLPAARILFENNVFEEVGRADLGGQGRLVQLLGGIEGIAFNHNTFLHSQAPGAQRNSAMMLEAGSKKMDPLIITNNIFSGKEYGVMGAGSGIGTVALNGHALSWQFVANAITEQNQYPYGAHHYPAGNFFPPSVAALQLDASLRVGPGSGLQGKATTGKDVGADIPALLAAIAGVVP